MTFQLGEENQDGLDLVLRPGVTLTGQVRIRGRETRPGEPVLPWDGWLVGVDAPFRGHLTESGVPVRAADGSFSMEGLISDRYWVYIAAKAPKGYKAAEVRYNGTAAPNNLIAINPEARVHRLDITMELASGSIAAAVTDGIRPAPGAIVVVAPESMSRDVPVELVMRLIKQEAADEEGRATIEGLLPGGYRVSAFPAGALWRNDSNLIERLITAQEVKVGASGPTVIQVRQQR